MSEVNRRQFLSIATASACAVISAHPIAALAPTQKSLTVSGGIPRILELNLESSVPLIELKSFYRDVLGLRILPGQSDRLVVGAGQTRLSFSEAIGSQAFYHFAFNIPENKIEAALEWQKKRTAMLPIPEALRDANHSNEVVDYRHWNAHSIFFLDPAGNVVEYIARHDLANRSEGAFDTRDILYVSEIGLIVDDVLASASSLKPVAGVEQYRGGDDHFIALGDESGLLLVIKRGRILNFNPSSDEKAARVFQTAVKVRGSQPSSYDFSPYPYSVLVDPTPVGTDRKSTPS
jgi:hypothetical protein